MHVIYLGHKYGGGTPFETFLPLVLLSLILICLYICYDSVTSAPAASTVTSGNDVPVAYGDILDV